MKEDFNLAWTRTPSCPRMRMWVLTPASLPQHSQPQEEKLGSQPEPTNPALARQPGRKISELHVQQEILLGEANAEGDTVEIQLSSTLPCMEANPRQ